MNNQYGYGRIGTLLINAGLIDADDLLIAVAEQKKTGLKLGQVLVKMGRCSEEDISKILADSTGFELKTLNDIGIDVEAANLITPEIAKKYNLMPISLEGNTLNVAMLNPNDVMAKDDLKFLTGYNIKPIIAADSEIKAAIENFANFSTGFATVEEEEDLIQEDLAEGASEEDNPAIALANQILHSAIRANASDIHIEPGEKIMRVRFRIDGVLHEMFNRPMKSHASLVSRIKVMGNMDIAERRIPLDGRATLKVDSKTVDIRIASLPSVYGEKLTLRLLVRSEQVVTMKELGLADYYQERLSNTLKTPYGFILVTGPTGSGKSTTLYASLGEVNTPDRNIITLEDPVERRVAGITQIQMNNKAGMTFASGLRSILRSDPDIVMVGEIRDTETAKIAIEAAMTGHLVFATLHTNDAPSTVTRLSEMGVESFLITSSLLAVVAQRLVRVLCPSCKEEVKMHRNDLLRNVPDFPLEPNEEYVSIYKAKGCISCNHTGYKGRMGVHEILVMSEEISAAILNHASTSDIEKIATEQGMVNLRLDGMNRVKKGLTSIEEILRVIV